MATWVVHLRIADALLSAMPDLPRVEFVIGNVAPDSGVATGDGGFDPPKTISHWWSEPETGTPRHIRHGDFYDAYIRDKPRDEKTPFYLGYFAHLLTDQMWATDVYRPCKEAFADEAERDNDAFLRDMKRDWYNLDFRYVREHPDFPALRTLRESGRFPNVYLGYFTENAIDDKLRYIADFYGKNTDQNREQRYLSQAQVEFFVETATEAVKSVIG